MVSKCGAVYVRTGEGCVRSVGHGGAHELASGRSWLPGCLLNVCAGSGWYGCRDQGVNHFHCPCGKPCLVCSPEAQDLSPTPPLPQQRRPEEPMTTWEALQAVHRWACSETAHDPICRILSNVAGKHYARRMGTAPCCSSHVDGVRAQAPTDTPHLRLWGSGLVARCCDPNDCGPCCENCPTCPSVARMRRSVT